MKLMGFEVGEIAHCSVDMVVGTQARQPSTCSLTPSEPLPGDGRWGRKSGSSQDS